MLVGSNRFNKNNWIYKIRQNQLTLVNKNKLDVIDYFKTAKF